MSPKKVKVALQCILIITFLTLCILSLDNLLKADTSLAFSKEDSAYFPSMTICPLRASLKALESFDDTSNISIRDYLKINLVESFNKSRKIQKSSSTKDQISSQRLEKVSSKLARIACSLIW